MILKLPRLSLFLLALFCAAFALQELRAQDRASDASLLADRGALLLERENYEKARRFCELSLVANPARASARACIGRAYQKTGKIKRAYQNYRTALLINPNNLQASTWSGEIEMARGDYQKAYLRLYDLEQLCGNCSRELENTMEHYASMGVAPPRFLEAP